MEIVKIEAQPRTDLGKKATKALRKQGFIPCNLYGGKGNLNFQAMASSFKSILFTPEFKMAEISFNGQTHRAIMKEVQIHPVTDAVTHIDFQELVEGTPVKVQIPLKFTGTPIAAAMGGKVEQTMRKMNVLAMPTDLVNEIELDISDMDFGAIKRVRDLGYEKLTFLHHAAIPVARLEVTRAVKEAEAAAAKEAKKK